jgi:hypothetical protein
MESRLIRPNESEFGSPFFYVRKADGSLAPADGAAAAAPEGGALVGPSAPTSTSTRWALLTQ